MELKKGYTERGFSIIEFIDLYGTECSIQESSLAKDNAIWIGVHKEQGRMHLNQEQVKEILPILIKFAETGELPE